MTPGPLVIFYLQVWSVKMDDSCHAEIKVFWPKKCFFYILNLIYSEKTRGDLYISSFSRRVYKRRGVEVSSHLELSCHAPFTPALPSRASTRHARFTPWITGASGSFSGKIHGRQNARLPSEHPVHPRPLTEHERAGAYLRRGARQPRGQTRLLELVYWSAFT